MTLTLAALSKQITLSPDDDDVLETACKRLMVAYNKDYFDEGKPEFMRVEDLMRRASEKGYTAAEFLQRLDEMVETCKFPTWTPADFFQHKRESLHVYHWMTEEVKKDATATMRLEAYSVPGVLKPLWRYADGEKLEEKHDGWKCVVRCGAHYGDWTPPERRIAVATPAEAAEPNEYNDITLAIARSARAEAEIERFKNTVREKERTIQRLNSEIERLQRKIDKLSGDTGRETAEREIAEELYYREEFVEAAWTMSGEFFHEFTEAA
jgi:hypothetical protein